MQLICAALERKGDFDEYKYMKLIQASADCISGTYPPIPGQPLCKGDKELFEFYRRLLQSCNGIESLRILMKGLMSWIEDKQNLVLDEEYNKFVGLPLR